MTLPELIGVHFGDGATPDEQATLSRALISDGAALREFVVAARVEGVLQARAEADGWADALAARLDVEGIACPVAVAERSPGGPGKLAAMAVGVLAVGFGGLWLLRQRGADLNHSGSSLAAIRRLPAVPLTDPKSRIPATPTPVSAPDWAGRFYLPALEFDDQPLDAVLERLLTQISEVNHLQRAELSTFELAWQPLNDASASNPPRVTISQSQVPLPMALEWIAILTDCRVRWDEQGAVMIESPPESGSGPSRQQRVLTLRGQSGLFPLAVTARFFALPVTSETATEVMGPDEYRAFVATLAEQGPVTTTLMSPSVVCLPGEPFQLEATDPDTTAVDRASRWSGLRVNGQTLLSGELIRVSAALHVWSAAADNHRSSQERATPASSPPREFTTEFEAFLPSGHTAVFPLSEADQTPALALHLTIDQAEAPPAPETPAPAATNHDR